MLGVDEVLRGGRMGYYIGLMGRIGLIRQIGLIRLMVLIRQIRLIGQTRQLGTNRAYQANRQIELVLYSTLEMLFKSNTSLVRKKILTLSIILIHHDRFY